MENYKVQGRITAISEVETLNNGAKKLSYRIDTGDQYSNIWEFELYKKEEYAEHVDNFKKYNNVGDPVEVEFSIRPREYQNKVYTGLSHWKIEKLEGGEQQPQNETFVAEGDDDLPF